MFEILVVSASCLLILLLHLRKEPQRPRRRRRKDLQNGREDRGPIARRIQIRLGKESPESLVEELLEEKSDNDTIVRVLQRRHGRESQIQVISQAQQQHLQRVGCSQWFCRCEDYLHEIMCRTVECPHWLSVISLVHLFQLVVFLEKKKLHLGQPIFLALTRLTVRKGDLAFCRHLFSEMDRRNLSKDVILLNLYTDCMATTTIQKCSIEDGFRVIEEFAKTNVSANARSYNGLLKLAVKLRDLFGAEEVFRRMKKKEIPPDLVFLNTYLDVCAEAVAGTPELGVQIFSQLTLENLEIRPDTFTFGTMIKICTKQGHLATAMEVLELMNRYQVQPNVVVYSTLIACCSQSRDGTADQAFALYERMRKENVEVNIRCVTALAKVVGRRGNALYVRRVLQIVDDERDSVHVDEVFFNTLLRSAGDTPDASFDLILDICRAMRRYAVYASNVTLSVCLHGLQRVRATDSQSGEVFAELLTYNPVKRYFRRNRRIDWDVRGKN